MMSMLMMLMLKCSTGHDAGKLRSYACVCTITWVTEITASAALRGDESQSISAT